MPLYTLLNNQTTNVTTPKLVATPTTGVNQPSTYQAFTASITGTGAVSATVQPVVSNDGITFSNFGSAISLSGTNSASGNVAAQAPFQYWGVTLASITGTGASVNCILSAS